jgi:dephospho-CoA kinase
MLIVGLAGGIATGKSLIAHEIAKLPGVVVVDADKVAWETYKKSTEIYKKLIARFGEADSFGRRRDRQKEARRARLL